MSEFIDKVIASEVAYLKDTGKGFTTCVDMILVSRKLYNDIVNSYMENGKQDTLPLVRSLAGYIYYGMEADEMDLDVGTDEPLDTFGDWCIGLSTLVSSAEANCTAGMMMGVMDDVSSLLRLCTAWLSKYSLDIQQRDGYEIEEGEEGA